MSHTKKENSFSKFYKKLIKLVPQKKVKLAKKSNWKKADNKKLNTKSMY